MPPLDTALAAAAPADMDVELPVDGTAWNLHLELLRRVGFFQGTTALGADRGQRRLVDLVDLSGRRRRAVGFGPVV
jgi:hypothetical protein